MRADLVLIEHLKALAQTLEPRHRHVIEAAALRIRQLSKPQQRVKLTATPPVVNATPAASIPAERDRHAKR